MYLGFCILEMFVSLTWNATFLRIIPLGASNDVGNTFQIKDQDDKTPITQEKQRTGPSQRSRYESLNLPIDEDQEYERSKNTQEDSNQCLFGFQIKERVGC